MSDIKLGNVPIVRAGDSPSRLSLLLWGTTGAGKTTLACTAPGKKLLINFDPDGQLSIASRDDVDVADFSGSLPTLVETFKRSDDPLGLATVIDSYDTIVLDSVSTITEMTLHAGIAKSKSLSKSGGSNISIETPGLQAYGIRNALAQALVSNLLAFTKKHNKHLIIIAHEAAPEKNEDGAVISVGILLGGQLPELIGLRFSEIWNVYDNATTKQRLILVRKARLRSPCKTRMFVTDKASEFEWHFDPVTSEGGTIESWFQMYKNNKFQKIQLPK